MPLSTREEIVPTAAVILDTNVFVAAGFNPQSASAHIVEKVRSGRLRMIWNEQTRREVEQILSKIPRLSWGRVADLFREEDQYVGETYPERFGYIPDPDDRKFAALSEATGVTLLSRDDDLLNSRAQAQVAILTPREYWELEQISL
jgi:predicted nucleic acid-binding protein